MKVFLRILLAALGVLVALLIFVLASIFVDGLLGRNRLDAITNTTFPNPAGEAVRAYLARPSGDGPFPTVIMIHEFWGLNEDILEKAEALAEEGYLVVAPDMFRGSTTGWIPRAIYQIIATPQENLIADLDAVFAGLANDPLVNIDRVAMLGFCFGGRTSLLYSLVNDRLAATVILYGSPETDPQVLAALPGPLLGIFGDADTSIPLARVQEFATALDQAGIPNQISIYEGQGHAFVSSMEAVRLGGAPGQAWQEILTFLEDTLLGESAFHQTNPQKEFAFGQDWRYLAHLVYEHSIFGSASHQP